MLQNIKFHSAEHEIQANKTRSAARDFQPGDLVWLSLKNVKSLRPSRKLDYKNAGPFKVLKAIGKYAFRLELPKSMKIHPVFHVSLLAPVAQDALPGQISGPVPPIEASEDDPEYEVEKITGTIWKDGEIIYVFRWKGYGPEDDWTIPASQASGFEELIKEFHELNPAEPRPKQKVSNRIQESRRSSARIKGR